MEITFENLDGAQESIDVAEVREMAFRMVRRHGIQVADAEDLAQDLTALAVARGHIAQKEIKQGIWVLKKRLQRQRERFRSLDDAMYSPENADKFLVDEPGFRATDTADEIEGLKMRCVVAAQWNPWRPNLFDYAVRWLAEGALTLEDRTGAEMNQVKTRIRRRLESSGIYPIWEHLA